MARRVWYYYDPEVPCAHFGPAHPMRPHRVRVTHALCKAFDLLDADNVDGEFEGEPSSAAAPLGGGLNRARVVCAEPLSAAGLAVFHDPNYVAFLRSASPRLQRSHDCA